MSNFGGNLAVYTDGLLTRRAIIMLASPGGILMVCFPSPFRGFLSLKFKW